MFEIKNFSQQGAQRLVSDKVLIHGRYWELVVEKDNLPGHISIYLSMNENSSFCYVNGNGVSYKYAMSVIHPINPSKNACRIFENVFDYKTSTHLCFYLNKLSQLNDYLSNDTLLVACNIHPEYKNTYIKPSIKSLSIEDSILLTDKHDYYPIQNGSHAKGYICIIANSQFSSSIFPELLAYKTDIEKILIVCTTNLAVNDKDIDIHQNLSSGQILEVFDHLSKKNFTDYDYIMIFILSHGYSGCIIGTDAIAIPYLQLQHYFYPDRCKSLTGKPKCFFLQGCRSPFSPSNTSTIPPHMLPPLPAIPLELDKSALSSVEKPKNYSKEEADFLFACACVDLSIAWTNTVSGSWYIAQLCKCLAHFSHSHHLLDTLIKVNQLLYKMSKDVEGYGVVSQMSVPSHTFTRKFRFFDNKEHIDNKVTEINVGSSVERSSSSSLRSSNMSLLYASTLPKNKGQQIYSQMLEARKKETKEYKDMPIDKRFSLSKLPASPQKGFERASSSAFRRSDLLFEDPVFLKTISSIIL